MMKRKMISYLLVIVVVFAMVGCGNGNQASDETKEIISDSDEETENEADGFEDENNYDDAEDESEQEEVSAGTDLQPTVEFVPWEEAGLQDHVMNWGDAELESYVRGFTGIADREIMLSDVWEHTEYYLDKVENISALVELTNITSIDFSEDTTCDISPLRNLPNLRELIIWGGVF